MELEKHNVIKHLSDKDWRMANLYKVRNKQGKTVAFIPNEVQQEFYNNRTNYDVVLKARQTTMSTAVIIDMLDECLFNENYFARTIADKQDNLKKLFGIAEFAYKHLPPLVKEMFPTQFANRYELKFSSNGSQYLVTLETHSESVNYLHFSEVSYIKNPEAIKESTETVMKGDNNKIVFESIANGTAGVGEYFHALYTDAKTKKNNYKHHFFEWFKKFEYKLELDEEQRVLLEESLTAKELGLIETFKLSLEQIAWRRWKIRDLKDDFYVKYAEDDMTCFISTGKHAFDSKLIAKYAQDYILKPIKRFKILTESGRIVPMPDGEMEVYEFPIEDEEYAIGGDVAKGVTTGDFSASYVLKKRTMQPVCRLYLHTDPKLFGKMLFYLGLYYNYAMIAPENNNRGHLTCDQLTRMRYKKIYYTGLEFGKKPKDGEMGWNTNVRNRTRGIDQFIHDFAMMLFDKLDQELLGEMSTFIQNERGKMEAATGKHDDLVMAFMIALQICVLFPRIERRTLSKAVKKLKEYTGGIIESTPKGKRKAKYEYDNVQF